jgi:hypothetical protein
MSVYQTGDGFVISSHQVWLPGVYDTSRTARYALQFSDRDLSDLWDRVLSEGRGRVTLDDLRSVKKTES